MFTISQFAKPVVWSPWW